MISAQRIKEYLIHFYYLLSPGTFFIQRGSKAIGDNLLLSGVLPFLRARYPKHKLIMETNLPELFENNPYLAFVTSIRWIKTYKHLKPRYRYDAEITEPLYSQLLSSIQLKGSAIPELYLSDREIAEVKRLFNHPYIAIAPSAKQTFAANRKDWSIQNFQEVINAFPNYCFVQVGSPDDPLLTGVIDARGVKPVSDAYVYQKNSVLPLFENARPVTIRGTAAIIWNSLLFVGLEGGLMHVARSVNKRSVIIYSGFVKPSVSGYPENINLFHDVPCAPCGHSDAPHTNCPDKICNCNITPESVKAGIIELL